MNFQASILLCALLNSIFALCFGQEAKQTGNARGVKLNPQLRSTQLEMFSQVEVPAVTEPYVATPISCSPDGVIFARVITSEVSPAVNLLSISGDGKQVIRFTPNKITDIDSPVFGESFATATDVYILVTGNTPKTETFLLRRPNGTVQKQQVRERRDYIAHFRRDGTYASAIALDLPFDPIQIGVFTDGNFLIAGTSQAGPRVALVKSSGQFLRFIELKGDVHLQNDAEEKKEDVAVAKKDEPSLPAASKSFDESLFAAEHLSVLVSYGRNLLLVRSGQRIPVFSISPGGEVKTVTADVPPGFNLWDLKPTRNEWIGLYTHKISDLEGMEFETYALDPETGKPLSRYNYPKNLGFALACTDGAEFTFLTRENDKLKLEKLVSVR